jgi:hypothetical protein
LARHDLMRPENWEISGNLEDHNQSLLESIYRTEGHKLRMIPGLKIHGSDSVDTGGVFRAKVNRLFEFLMMKCFKTDDTSKLQTFASSTDIPDKDVQKYYYTFGKILYWFVLFHGEIPYPVGLDPIILSYCIYGYVTPAAANHRNRSVVNIAKQIDDGQPIRQRGRSAIDSNDDLTAWLRALMITKSEFNQCCRSLNSKKLIAQWFTTIAMLGKHLHKIGYIREGFTNAIGFTTVTFLLTID